MFNVNSQTCVQLSPLGNGKMTDIHGDCYIQVNLQKVKGKKLKILGSCLVTATYKAVYTGVTVYIILFTS